MHRLQAWLPSSGAHDRHLEGLLPSSAVTGDVRAALGKGFQLHLSESRRASWRRGHALCCQFSHLVFLCCPVSPGLPPLQQVPPTSQCTT